MKYDIFISYSRRDIDLVKSIKAAIEEAAKVVCWMDLKAIESGSKRFTKDIIDGINNCGVFLFMLSENSQNAEFALRELLFANKKGKHVVLINIDSCQLTDEFLFLYGLTDTIDWTDMPQREKLYRDLWKWVVTDVGKDGFVSAEELEPIDASVQTPVDRWPHLKLKSDLDCIFYLDDEEKLRLKANEIQKISLNVGEYELKFVSVENEADWFVEDFVMPAADKLYKVGLRAVRKARLEQEEQHNKEKEEKERLEAEKKVREVVEKGAVKGVFSISPTKKVCFSKGNLQYQASTDIWRFAERQSEFVGEENKKFSPYNQDWIDLFPCGKKADFDLGHKRISNGGNQENLWHTLTSEEWVFVLDERNTSSGLRYAKARVDGVNGLILLPDNWDKAVFPLKKANRPNAGFDSNLISGSKWEALEVAGAVFLPAAGYRSGESVDNVGSRGYYWSTSYEGNHSAYFVYFNDVSLTTDETLPRHYGFAVRLAYLVE